MTTLVTVFAIKCDQMGHMTETNMVTLLRCICDQSGHSLWVGFKFNFFRIYFAPCLIMFINTDAVFVLTIITNQYILRDETVHLNFGIDLINGIKEENQEIWTPAFQKHIIDLIKEAVELEIDYAKECLPKGILGLSAPMFREYVQHIADRRLERIGLKPIFKSKNPFPWMSETIDLGKEKNFFESRVNEYQSSASLSWN